MKMENLTLEHPEFEEMRSQLELLKNKIAQEEIINDKLLRETMKFRLSSINKQVWIDIISAVIGIFLYLFFFPFLPVWLLAFVVILMVADVTATVLVHRPVREKLIMNDDLKTVANKMRRLKKAYITIPCVELPILIVFVALFLKELVHYFGNVPSKVIICGGIMGALIGLAIVLVMFRRIIKNSDDIIKQIEE